MQHRKPNYTLRFLLKPAQEMNSLKIDIQQALARGYEERVGRKIRASRDKPAENITGNEVWIGGLGQGVLLLSKATTVSDFWLTKLSSTGDK